METSAPIQPPTAVPVQEPTASTAQASIAAQRHFLGSPSAATSRPSADAFIPKTNTASQPVASVSAPVATSNAAGASSTPTVATLTTPPQPKTSQSLVAEAADSNTLKAPAPAETVGTQQASTPTPPPSRLESRFQGAALYKKFAQN